MSSDLKQKLKVSTRKMEMKTDGRNLKPMMNLLIKMVKMKIQWSKRDTINFLFVLRIHLNVLKIN